MSNGDVKVTDVAKLPNARGAAVDAQFPPLAGVTEDVSLAGVTGVHRNRGAGVRAESQSGPGVSALSRERDGVVSVGANNGIVGRTNAANHSGCWADNTGGGFGVAGTSDVAGGVGAYGRGGRVGVYGGAPGDDGRHPEAVGGLAGFFAGDVVVTGDIRLANADCAEEFNVSEAAAIEPGTVVIIDGDAVSVSRVAYDKRVAGVISGAGEYKPGIVLDKRCAETKRAPVALLGKVYCKVDAGYAPIEIGDLLTTSATPGHAMKVSDPLRAFGAVLGKALRPLSTGQATIPMLIALQ